MIASALLLAAVLTDPPAAVRAAVSAELAEDAAVASVPPAMMRQVDANGDNRADWHIDYQVAGETRWCGSGGCRHQLFVARPDGSYSLAFDETARSFTVRGGRVVVDVYGSYCGTAGVVDCVRAFAWREKEGRLVPVPDRRQDSKLFGPLFQPVTIARQDWPETVARVVAVRAAACTAAGATLDEGASAIVRSPDLDGDGLNDWIVGSPWSACLPPDAMPQAQVDALPRPTLVVLTSGSGNPAVIFATAGTDYLVDISTTPATLVLMPGEDIRIQRCPDRPTRCPGTALRWNPALRRLVPVSPTIHAPPVPPAPRTGRRRVR